MSQFIVQTKAYVGKVLDCSVGGWLTLPMNPFDLTERINQLNFGTSEYQVMDLDTKLPVWRELTQLSISDLNEALRVFTLYETIDRLGELLTAFKFRNGDLNAALRLLEVGNYNYFTEVADEESLGEAAVKSGWFGEWLTSDNLEDNKEIAALSRVAKLKLVDLMRYVDYNRIAEDLIGNGCIIYPDLQTAIMETSRG